MKKTYYAVVQRNWDNKKRLKKFEIDCCYANSHIELYETKKQAEAIVGIFGELEYIVRLEITKEYVT